MNIILQISHLLESCWLATVMLDAALKSTLLLSLAGGFCLLWRRASAGVRHLIWFGAIIGSLCFPVMSFVAPRWQQPLWTVGGSIDSGNQLTFAISVIPETHKPGVVRTIDASSPPSAPNPAPRKAERPLLHGSMRLSRVGILIGLWCCGLLVALSRILIDRLRLRFLSTRSTKLTDESWLVLLRELQRHLGLRQPVTLLQSCENVMPATWGTRHPTILLPMDASCWVAQRRRLVLLHELAHVKRRDCLSQLIARLTCAVYWFNPLTWVASWRMCVEREHACDDLVLNEGFKGSEYAAHLLEIVRTYPQLPRAAGIAIARSSQLKKRISSILESSHARPPCRVGFVFLWLLMSGVILAIAGNQPGPMLGSDVASQSLFQRQLAQLEVFSSAKLKQSKQLAAGAGEKISPEFQRFFTAGTAGDSQTVTNMYESFKRRHPQYSNATNADDVQLSTAYWSPVLEICLAYDQVVRCTPKYTQLLADEIINSIPPGSIYFGGTDPGRGIPTAFSKSQIDADPFFVVTQNALADGSYLQYLRDTYDNRIYTPTDADSQQCFNDYLADALKRLDHDKKFPSELKRIRPGENVRMEDGKGTVSGQVAVMKINALLVKLIFDRNPTRDFYIEESFPLDWMYPNLEPHGLIMKINRNALVQLPDEVVALDRAYWEAMVARMVGNWLTQQTSIKSIAEFVERDYLQKNLTGFTGDPGFIQNDYAKRTFSKLRSSIAGVYAWRNVHPSTSHEAQRMDAEADLAFRQAYVLCPYNPEALFRYATFLSEHHRTEDALLLATTSLKLQPDNKQFEDLARHLKNAETLNE